LEVLLVEKKPRPLYTLHVYCSETAGLAHGGMLTTARKTVGWERIWEKSEGPMMRTWGRLAPFCTLTMWLATLVFPSQLVSVRDSVYEPSCSKLLSRVMRPLSIVAETLANWLLIAERLFELGETP